MDYTKRVNEADSCAGYTSEFDRTVGGDGCEFTVCHGHGGDKAPPAYAANAQLPEAIRSQTPEAIQTLYREAYNQTWRTYVMPIRRGFKMSHHEVSDRAGWAAVRKQYSQIGSTWVRRQK